MRLTQASGSGVGPFDPVALPGPIEYYNGAKSGFGDGFCNGARYHFTTPFCQTSRRSRVLNSRVMAPEHSSDITISAAYMLA